MMTTNITVEHAEDLKRGHVTTVSSGGWCVTISGPNVTVPGQDSAGKSIEDLAALLQAAYRMAATPINSGIGLLARVRTSLSEPLMADLVAVLRAAQRLAAQQWNRASRDVYRCLALAWRNTGMAVPYTLLVAALRAGLPPSTTLCDFNSDANLHSVHALFEIAIARLTNGAAAVHVA
ncbi:hypothetical protein [Mycobacterium sp. 1465703.0]|uniref:hypothetical protein n=1 Tax=Mycobacterium sp. 1465703.0 TaxID=1834078 RepID=UPI0008016989|nr:hypothetical protein [Mycobacterium sp. 1465703.0]OBJ10874.1 hypothetical protein A5625_10410 [Mycobacterium sp. 1465703.0]